jgi:SH3-like domain-containing protein
VAGWLAWVNAPLGAAANSFALPPATVATPFATAAATALPAAPPTAPAPKATPASVATATRGVQRRIVNTDGRGVALRDGPGGSRLAGKGYDEGVTVTAFESSGGWTRIRGSDGREGWVLSVTLEP